MAPSVNGPVYGVPPVPKPIEPQQSLLARAASSATEWLGRAIERHKPKDSSLSAGPNPVRPISPENVPDALGKPGSPRSLQAAHIAELEPAFYPPLQQRARSLVPSAPSFEARNASRPPSINPELQQQVNPFEILQQSRRMMADWKTSKVSNQNPKASMKMQLLSILVLFRQI